MSATSTSSLTPTPTPPPLAPPAATTSPSGKAGGGGPTSSPLLFFVALGFGVVFTNLWIIVGVKYCFRYSQRNRRLRHEDNGEPVDMVTMPHGPRRRKREKKLMTMDEVNERFPLLKYKAWVTTRAEEGLPTAGGVAAPSASRAASLRNAEGTIGRKSGDTQRPATPADKDSMEQHAPSPGVDENQEPRKASDEPKAPVAQNKEAKAEQKKAETSTLADARTDDAVDDVDDDDDQIQIAVPTEMMATPGDSCAICIDTLEDDDDVRGLKCGHAFHASCLDPWLTSRRACCPLCKADYYVPKPRPEGEAAADTERQSGRRGHGQRMDMPHVPQDAFLVGRRRPRFLPARFMVFGHDTPAYGATPYQSRRNQNRPTPPASAEPTTNEVGGQGYGRNSFMPSFSVPRPNLRVPNFMRRNQQRGNNTPAEPGARGIANSTPAQLEAGQR